MVRAEFREVESLWDWALVWFICVMPGIFGFCEDHVVVFLVNLRVFLVFFYLISPRLGNFLNRMHFLESRSSFLLSLFHRHDITHCIIKPHPIYFHLTDMLLDILFALTLQKHTLTFHKLFRPIVCLLGLGYQSGECPVHAFVVLEKTGLGKELYQEVFVALGELGGWLVGFCDLCGFLWGHAFVLVDDWWCDVVHFLVYECGQLCDLVLLGFKYFLKDWLLILSLFLRFFLRFPFSLRSGSRKGHLFGGIDLADNIRGDTLGEGNW